MINLTKSNNTDKEIKILASIPDIQDALFLAQRLNVFGDWYETLTNEQKHEINPNLN